MAVWTLGLNHKTAPIDLRERFAFASERLDQSLKGLRQSLPRTRKWLFCPRAIEQKFTVQVMRFTYPKH